MSTSAATASAVLEAVTSSVAGLGLSSPTAAAAAALGPSTLTRLAVEAAGSTYPLDVVLLPKAALVWIGPGAPLPLPGPRAAAATERALDRARETGAAAALAVALPTGASSTLLQDEESLGGGDASSETQAIAARLARKSGRQVFVTRGSPCGAIPGGGAIAPGEDADDALRFPPVALAAIEAAILRAFSA